MTRAPASPAPRRTPVPHMAHLPSLPHLPPALDLQAAATRLERPLAQAFRPMDKRAFGLAVGLVAGLLVALVTAARLLLDPEGRTNLALLANFFPGYRESWAGAAVGAAWGLAVGAVAGWFAAFVRNLVLALWLLWLRMRVQFTATHDFLDHI